MQRLAISLTAILLLGSCAYYNTFYNAEEYFKQAEKVTRDNQTGSVSREETQLYGKAIEKSKKLLTNYPNSKYTDDAQFIIGRSYFHRGDFGLSEKYFEELLRLYPNSPYTTEVPLWIARCLVKRGDVDMARHEAGRILADDEDDSFHAQAYLLLGEIAVAEDSVGLARIYLERVVSTSRDGLVRAQAQYQIGMLLENSGEYEEALEAFKRVTRYKPSEALKVQSIIAQNSMLKALDRDEEALRMIETMLVNDKFADIRGQLEIELGKIFFQQQRFNEAESRFSTVLETYAGQEYAAQAAFYLGEYYMFNKHDYKLAAEHYANVSKQFRKSTFTSQATTRTKQIERYKTIQFDYTNLHRQLAGYEPKTKGGNKSRANTRSRTNRGRKGRTAANPANPDFGPQGKPAPVVEKQPEVRKEVAPEDSLLYLTQICENRYTLAEYMLFEFSDVDTTLHVMDSLMHACVSNGLGEQASYMRYYIFETIQQDEVQAAEALAYIEETYPEYYQEVHQVDDTLVVDEMVIVGQKRFDEAAVAFDTGDLTRANELYMALNADTLVSAELRAQSLFNLAWLNDHFLLERDMAIAEYQEFIATYGGSPLMPIAQRRLEMIAAEAPPSNIEVSPDGAEQTPAAGDEPSADN